MPIKFNYKQNKKKQFIFERVAWNQQDENERTQFLAFYRLLSAQLEFWRDTQRIDITSATKEIQKRFIEAINSEDDEKELQLDFILQNEYINILNLFISDQNQADMQQMLEAWNGQDRHNNNIRLFHLFNYIRDQKKKENANYLKSLSRYLYYYILFLNTSNNLKPDVKTQIEALSKSIAEELNIEPPVVPTSTSAIRQPAVTVTITPRNESGGEKHIPLPPFSPLGTPGKKVSDSSQVSSLQEPTLEELMDKFDKPPHQESDLTLPPAAPLSTTPLDTTPLYTSSIKPTGASSPGHNRLATEIIKVFSEERYLINEDKTHIDDYFKTEIVDNDHLEKDPFVIYESLKQPESKVEHNGSDFHWAALLIGLSNSKEESVCSFSINIDIEENSAAFVRVMDNLLTEGNDFTRVSFNIQGQAKGIIEEYADELDSPNRDVCMRLICGNTQNISHNMQMS